MFRTSLKSAALAILLAAGLASSAAGQAAPADPHHPDAAATQPAPAPASPDAEQAQSVWDDQPGVMPVGMMCQDMMGQGMMGRGMMGMMGRGMMDQGTAGSMQPGMMDGMPMMGMRRHMMKFMFAIADTNGDGALSFEEITAIHKRIFDKADANKDGKVTPEEIQAFMQN